MFLPNVNELYLMIGGVIMQTTNHDGSETNDFLSTNDVAA